jgi:hypothetical protein
MTATTTTAQETAANERRMQHAQPDAATDRYEDDTTLKFSGRMNVADEDAGGDPYNHTGRFRRTIR